MSDSTTQSTANEVDLTDIRRTMPSTSGSRLREIRPKSDLTSAINYLVPISLDQMPANCQVIQLTTQTIPNVMSLDNNNAVTASSSEVPEQCEEPICVTDGLPGFESKNQETSDDSDRDSDYKPKDDSSTEEEFLRTYSQVTPIVKYSWLRQEEVEENTNALATKKTKIYGERKQCKMCGNTFLDNKSLQRHWFREHPNQEFVADGKHVCPIDFCLFSFSTENKYNDHMLTQHGIDRPYACDHPDCDYRAKVRHKLIGHKKTHLNRLTRPFVCTIANCGRRFASSSIRNNHLKSYHSTSSYPCTHGCDKTFKCKDTLRQHLRRTHLQRDKYKCQWPGCGFTSPERTRYDKHLRTHTYERPFECGVDGCDKRFIALDTLRQHMRNAHKISQISDDLLRVRLLSDDTSNRTVTVGRKDTNSEERRTMKSVDINDVLEELSEENKRLLNELSSAKKLLIVFNRYKNFIDFNSNSFEPNLKTKDLQNYRNLKQSIEKELKGKSIRSERETVINGLEGSPDNGCDEVLAQNEDISDNSNGLPDCGPEEESLTESESIPVKNKRIKKNVKVMSRKKNKPNKNMTPKKNKNTPEERKYCQLCCKSYGCYADLRKHWKVKHPDQELIQQGKHVCPITDCPYSFKSEDKFNDHMLSEHQIERPYPCSHPGCDYRGKISKELARHMATHSDIQVECTVADCDRKFANIRSRDLHLANYHSKQTYKCDLCSKIFKRKDCFDAHRRKIHLERTKYGCQWPGCDYRAPTQSRIVYHMRTHTNERPFLCDIPGCDRRFAMLESMKIHKKRAHKMGEEFVCNWPECGYKTRQKSLMKSHEWCHETGGHLCPWPGCGKRVASKATLKEHINVHKNVKPYACPVAGCTYRTAVSRNISQHMRTHRKK